MCIEEINYNRELNNLSVFTGNKNIEILENSGYTNVATNNQWYKLGRTNLKGAEFITLWGVKKGAKKSLKDIEEMEEEEVKKYFFKFKVYDIKNTRELTEEEIERRNKKFNKKGAKK